MVGLLAVAGTLCDETIMVLFLALLLALFLALALAAAAAALAMRRWCSGEAEGCGGDKDTWMERGKGSSMKPVLTLLLLMLVVML